MSDGLELSLSEWKAYVTDSNLTLIEICLKLAQIIEYPNLNITNEVQKINNLGITLKHSIVEAKSTTYRISLLNEFLFETFGFGGHTEDY